jgi:two-component system, NarL family, nitrate/nitrite response regulator NarL
LRVLLVDDHELVWNGTRRLLESVLAEARPAEELVFQAVRDMASAVALAGWMPDLVLLDYRLPDASGLVALRKAQGVFERTPICMLSAEDNPQRVREVLEAGAAGFIPKGYAEGDMVSALRLVLRQRTYVPAEFMFAEEVQRKPEADELPPEAIVNFLRHELSPRQRQVLRLALQGLANKSIARQLDIAEGTVKVHLSMVYRALGVRNRVGALCRVLQADAAEALE